MVDVINQETKELLQQIIKKIEKLEEEKKIVLEAIRDVYNEAKSHGFDAKIMKHIIKIRKMNRAALEEQEELIDLYKHALGME